MDGNKNASFETPTLKTQKKVLVLVPRFGICFLAQVINKN